MSCDPLGWQLTIILCVCVVCYTASKCFIAYLMERSTEETEDE